MKWRTRSAGGIGVALWLAVAAPATAVVGGQLIDPTIAPWLARVDGECGGTLIAPDRVLTSAGCAVGPDRLKPADVQIAGTSRAVVRFAMHPGWRHRNGGGFRDDVAILQLNEPVTGVQPVTLGVNAQAAVRIVGFGDFRLFPEAFDLGVREAFLKPLDDAACARAYRRHRGFHGERFDALRMGCAADIDGRRPLSSACLGDEGGPLLDAAAPTPVLLGVVSWHDARCGGDRRPTVFADVGYNRGFMTNPSPGWAPTSHSATTIVGVPRVGRTLNCIAPSFDYPPTGLAFRWYRFAGEPGSPLSAGVGGPPLGRQPTFRVRRRYRGERLTCRVIARNNGGIAISEASPVRVSH